MRGEDANAFACPLLGGDTVSTPGPLSISIAAFGRVLSGRMVRRSGMSVRATIQPNGAATRQQARLTEVAMTNVVISGSTKTGSVKSVWKLASVKARVRSVKANTTSQPMGRTTSRHSTAANSAITAPDRSKRVRAVRTAGVRIASTVMVRAPTLRTVAIGAQRIHSRCRIPLPLVGRG